MPAGDKSMIHRPLIFSAFAFACLVVPSKAENIVCPPENDIAATFDKWTPDYAAAAVDTMPDGPRKMARMKEIGMANAAMSKGDMRAACKRNIRAQK
jgi:hypothetical protein